jgi:uncharacterized membrane protein (UPF0127 family)
MSVRRQVLDLLMPRRQRAPDVQWKIVNLTRQAVLADRVEVASHAAKRNKGLLGRDGLEPGEGLWIVPCEAVHTFGMRFSIDLVYVDRSRRVRKVRSSVPPWRMSACLSAHSVVELASGTVRATQTKVGDTLEFSPFLPLEPTVRTISPL